MEFTYENIMEHFEQLIDAVDDYAFSYLTEKEITVKKRAIKFQLELDTSFKLLTRLEADIKTSYYRCIMSKSKRGLGKEYNILCDKHIINKKCNEKRVDCCRGKEKISGTPIKDIFKTTRLFFAEKGDNETARYCSALKAYFNRDGGFRNWYAHGRYFKHSPSSFPQPSELYHLCEHLSKAIEAELG